MHPYGTFTRRLHVVPPHFIERILPIGIAGIISLNPVPGPSQSILDAVPSLRNGHVATSPQRIAVVGSYAIEIVVRPRRIRLAVHQVRSVVIVAPRKRGGSPSALQNGVRHEIHLVHARALRSRDDGGSAVAQDAIAVSVTIQRAVDEGVQLRSRHLA